MGTLFGWRLASCTGPLPSFTWGNFLFKHRFETNKTCFYLNLTIFQERIIYPHILQASNAKASGFNLLMPERILCIFYVCSISHIMRKLHFSCHIVVVPRIQFDYFDRELVHLMILTNLLADRSWKNFMVKTI